MFSPLSRSRFTVDAHLPLVLGRTGSLWRNTIRRSGDPLEHMVDSPGRKAGPSIAWELLNNPDAPPPAWNAAWAELEGTYSPMLWRFLRDIAGDTHPDDLKDIVNATWGVAHLKLSGVRDVRKFEPWLRTIARRLLGWHVRGPGSSLVAAAEHAILEETTDPQPAVDDILVADDLYEQVYERLENPRDRALFEAKAHDHLTRAEIAEWLAISPEGAKKALQRLRQKIRPILQDLGVDDDAT